jgi:hypothetical protein
MVFGTSIAGYSGDLSRRVYLVLFVLLLAVAAGIYLRQRAKAAEALRQANCETPAPPPKPATPPPDLPGFAVEPACGTGAEAANTPPPAAKSKGK